MKQADLAREMGTTQTAISRIENVNYDAWNIKTFKKLARAFHVRLRVSFETYGTLVGEVESFSRESLQRFAREDDPGLVERKPPQHENDRTPLPIAMSGGGRNDHYDGRECFKQPAGKLVSMRSSGSSDAGVLNADNPIAGSSSLASGWNLVADVETNSQLVKFVNEATAAGTGR